jgi:peptidoglycan/LPS O-acetylase OafA/YrhL
MLLDIYRFVLAVFVVQAHIPWAWRSGQLSWHAVFSFYVLSGFLMTLILNESYGFGARGFARFWANRFLRLYPAYAVVVAITALHMLLVSPLTQLYPIIGWPESFYGWVANITMFGMAGPETTLRPVINFIPNAWSLSVELFCYVLLSVYFAKTQRRALVLLVIGIVITGAELVRAGVQALPQYDFQNHYGVLQAGIIPFAAGSLAYFYRASPLLRFSPARFAALLVLWAANWALAHMHMFAFHTYVSSLYVSVAINVFLVAMMFDHDATRARPRAAKVLGAIAYPVFVAHILMGTLVFHYLPFARGVLLLPITLAVTVGFSLAVHEFVERPIERLRVLIKQVPRTSVLPRLRRARTLPGVVQTR